MKNNKIEKFEKIIKENENSFLHLTILYYMSCNEEYYKFLSNEQKEKLLDIIYNFYLKDENFVDLAHIVDVVMQRPFTILKMQKQQEFFKIRHFISAYL